MNKRLKNVICVTKWEFNRFFKWKNMLKGTLILLIFAGIGAAAGIWLATDSISVPEIAVHSYGIFESDEFDTEQIRFIDRSAESMDNLERELGSGEIDGILTISTPDSATIKMEGERAWLLPLRQVLNEQRTAFKLREHDISETVFDEIEQNMIVHAELERGSDSSIADKVVAGIAIFLLLTAVFMGFAYQFTAITAEKQQRITEQVVSAISPQTWIDGKILGITGIGLVYVVYYSALGLVAAGLLITFANAPLQMTFELIDPYLVIVFLLLSIFGILMINSFMAGIAATIDDPNSSQKGGLMMLPIYPVMFAFFTLMNPDSFAITFFGIFPLTSYAVLPARMVMTQVAWWEPVLAIVLLAGTAWIFRLAAGKIFSTAMLMYGKEPTLKEMAYWFRKTN